VEGTWGGGGVEGQQWRAHGEGVALAPALTLYRQLYGNSTGNCTHHGGLFLLRLLPRKPPQKARSVL
jgi:hypothetical protein